MLLTKHEVNMGGYWLSSFLPFLWPGTMGGDPQKCKKRLVNEGFIIIAKDFALITIKNGLFISRARNESQLCL